MFRRQKGIQPHGGPRRKILSHIDGKSVPTGTRDDFDCTGTGKEPGPYYSGKTLAIGHERGWRGPAAVTAFAVRIGVLSGVIPSFFARPLPVPYSGRRRRRP